MRRDSFGRAHGRLLEQLAATAPLVLGVSRDGMIHGATKIETASSRRLAEALHRQRVALVIIGEDVRPVELEQFLGSLAPDRHGGAEIPLWDRLVAAGVRGIALEPVDYQAVMMTEGAPLEGRASSSIWEAITRELLVGRRLLSREREPPVLGSAEEVAHWIESLLREGEPPGEGFGTGDGTSFGQGGPGATAAGGEAAGVAGPPGGTGTGGPGARDHGSRAEAVAAGLGGAVAAHLGRERGPVRKAAVVQVLDLANRLPPTLRAALLQASLRALATDEEAGEALRAVAASQPPAGVLSALRQLAAERVQLSASALRLARELTLAAQAAQEEAAPLDQTAYDAIVELFREVDIDRIGPQAPSTHDSRAVVELPRVRPLAADEVPDLGPRRDTLADEQVARQLASTLLELVAAGLPRQAPDEAILWRLEDLYRGFLLNGRIRQATEVAETLLGLLEQTRAAGGPDAELRRCIDRLGNREAVTALLAALPGLPDDAAASARQLIDLLGAVSVRHLVAALSEENDRSRRHQLLGLLSSLGGAVVPHATLLLGDSRWFVVRNMIALLRSVGDQTSLPQIRRCAEHPDLRVRLEAIKSLFAIDSQVPTELLSRAINDPNPKVAEAAISLVGSYGIGQAVAPLVALLRRWDPFGRRRGLRLKALRALGRLGDPAALPQLEPFFREHLRIHARAERLAAFAALAGYPEAARQPLVARGLRSRDGEVRAVCSRLLAGDRSALDETHV